MITTFAGEKVAQEMRAQKPTVVAIFALLIALLPATAAAAPQGQGSSASGQTLHILVGKSVLINSQARMTRILASNPTVINEIATSPTEVVIEGLAAGTSSLIIWDETNQSQLIDVFVDLDVAGLRQAIARAYPGQPVEVQADGGRLVLSGKVTDPKIVDDVMKLAGLYSNQVVNSMTAQTAHDKQVLLEVKFAEVDRTKLNQFGINILSTGASNTIGALSTNQFSSAAGAFNLQGVIGAQNTGTTSNFTLSNLLNVFLFRPDLNLAATLQDLESKNVLQILASPNLLAMNGQKASFLAGGEFPFPVIQGTQALGAITIQFRPFGVKLDFTGFINTDNVIRMHVAPEVSTLDFTNAVTISGFTVPALSTRRAETDVELRDGESFGIAGLIDNRVTSQMTKLPGFADIPILGQLFRSKSINRTNSELMVIVTPHIVDPLAPNQPQIVLPHYPFPFLTIPNFDTSVGSVKNEGTTSNQSHN